MQTVLVKARVLDLTHLELSEPITTRRGLTLLISVTDAEGADDRQQWIAVSAASLQASYTLRPSRFPHSAIERLPAVLLAPRARAG